MKKIISIALSVVLAMSVLVLAGCGSEETADKPEVTVLAAASLTD